MIPLLLLSAVAATLATPAMADNDRRGHGGYDRGSRDYRRDYRRDDRRDDRSHWNSRRDDRGWDRGPSRGYVQPHRWEGQPRGGYYRPAYPPRPVVVHPRPVIRPAYGYGYGPRLPPPWAVGRSYRSYGYGNVYDVPYGDYGRYDLYAPGYGRRWVRDDAGNFLLIAAATGVIASILTR